MEDDQSLEYLLIILMGLATGLLLAALMWWWMS